ncbi:MAG: acyl carrier protein [Luteimonas sp.]
MASNPVALPLSEQVLEVFAKEARVDRSRLRLDLPASELGVSSLDLALAIFEIEDRFQVQLPESLLGAGQPTIGELVAMAVERIEQRVAAENAA